MDTEVSRLAVPRSELFDCLDRLVESLPRLAFLRQETSALVPGKRGDWLEPESLYEEFDSTKQRAGASREALQECEGGEEPGVLVSLAHECWKDSGRLLLMVVFLGEYNHKIRDRDRAMAIAYEREAWGNHERAIEIANRDRVAKREARLADRPSAAQPESSCGALCSKCRKRQRHFDDLCKRCANDLGIRPSGKIT